MILWINQASRYYEIQEDIIYKIMITESGLGTYYGNRKRFGICQTSYPYNLNNPSMYNRDDIYAEYNSYTKNDFLDNKKNIILALRILHDYKGRCTNADGTVNWYKLIGHYNGGINPSMKYAQDTSSHEVRIYFQTIEYKKIVYGGKRNIK